ncbi:MAG: glycerol kinase GlpK [Myxococcales bacterium]|nr:glycerol kinase GlpK [Myxococcales bacterium]MCB9532394.1 glycerol kinase GlpK [Myxococcales bacterium]
MLLAIDQGTTGSTAVLLTEQLDVVASANQEFPQIFPHPGWVEHNPQAIWASVEGAVTAALTKARVPASAIRAIGITNQRETTVVWDRASGQPIANAIVWQCRRTADFCRSLREAGHSDDVRARTGLVLDPYFSGTKLRWLLDNVEGARARAARGELAFGTMDTYLLWRLTGGAVHATDVSNASRTMLMNLASAEWDSVMIERLGVEASMLPEIRGNAEVFGTTKGVGFLPDGIPIAGMAGDQQSALFGQACFAPGQAKCTFGTGAFLLMNTGAEAIASQAGLLTTAAWRVGGEMTYALEGSAFIAGAVVQWLRDEMRFFGSAAEIEALAASVEDSGGVVLVPAFTGLGAPHWNAEARGVIWGITRGTGRAHIARAALEGIAHQNRDILAAMEADLGRRLTLLRVDGGAAANDLLMQFQSDLLDVEISRPVMLETTALGAALLAGLGVGVFEDLDAVRSVWREQRRFTPAMPADERARRIDLWRAGVARV